MGNSFTSFHDKGFWCRDGLLEAWLRILALNLPTDVYDTAHWLHGLRDQWMFASSGLCNGWVSPCLDEYATDAKKVSVIIAASNKAISRLRAFGSTIPAAFLNALGNDGTSFGDKPLAWFEDLHHAFVALLNGELQTDASSGFALPNKT
jgi:hypothetical protein